MENELSFLPGRVLVGFSGGADSTALMCLLAEKSTADGSFVAAVHVNHGMRGKDSDSDEEFVRQFCRKKGIPLQVFNLNLPAHSSEDEARKARYACFRQSMEHFHTDCLALAHHMDDQAETVLMRLMRGTGLTGLVGIRQDTTDDGMRICRPLLSFSRDELQSWLISIDQPWREDGSNLDESYLRNSVRRRLLPLMEEMSPGCKRRIAKTANILSSDESALRLAESAAYVKCVEQNAVNIANISAEDSGMQRRIVRRWFFENAGKTMDERNLSWEKTAELTRIINDKSGTKCNLPGGIICRRGWTHLHLMKDSHSLTEQCRISAGYSIAENTSCIGDGLTSQLFPVDFAKKLVLRTPEAGDFIIPFGSSFKKPLEDFLTDKHVDYPFRSSLPILADGSQVYWVCGVGCGNIPKVNKSHDSEKYVMIMWNGNIPWKKENR